MERKRNMTTSIASYITRTNARARKIHKIKSCCLVVIIFLFLFGLYYAVTLARSKVKMLCCGSVNMYQLNFAIGDNYQYFYGKYPQYQSEDGTPLWSWRVALDRYRFSEEGFHIDEPWNSEHNLKGTERSDNDRPFVCPFHIHKDKLASYVAVTGPGTVWTETNNGNVKYPRETCRDMILFIETTEPKNHWAEPGDDVSPEEVIRLFQADPGLVKNSKQFFPGSGGHWPKRFATVEGWHELFSEIKSVEELRKRLYVPEEFLINKPVPVVQDHDL